MIWEQFEATAPEMAAVGRAQFEQRGVALIGTIRKDGSPRISCVEPCIVVHNTICTSTGDEVEFSLCGRVIDIHDPQVRRRYRSERTSWQEPHFQLFALDIESASLIEYGRGEQSVKVWPVGRAFKRPYG